MCGNWIPVCLEFRANFCGKIGDRSCFKNILNLLEFQRALPRRDVSLEFVAIVGAIFILDRQASM